MEEFFENGVFSGTIAGKDGLSRLPAEYKDMVRKVAVAHMVNEMAGAEAFDVPAVALAKTAEDKWMALQIAQEEYGHHVHFARLARTLDVDPESVDFRERANNIFKIHTDSWIEFLMVKAIVDLGEIVMVDDLMESSYLPLKELSIKTLPEERFHTGFGRRRLQDVCKTEEGRAEAQLAAGKLYPVMLQFFGGSVSRNNELYRKWRIKRRTNDEMRADYTARVDEVLTDLGLHLPAAV